jgi:hypothetical protein
MVYIPLCIQPYHTSNCSQYSTKEISFMKKIFFAVFLLVVFAFSAFAIDDTSIRFGLGFDVAGDTDFGLSLHGEYTWNFGDGVKAGFGGAYWFSRGDADVRNLFAHATMLVYPFALYVMESSPLSGIYIRGNFGFNFAIGDWHDGSGPGAGVGLGWDFGEVLYLEALWQRYICRATDDFGRASFGVFHIIAGLKF